jgi:2-polyprenyl-3-methyl-5-hydroxy-6-metoxy-1,4-benzoquinol methylase
VLDIGAGFGNIIYLLREKKNINYDGLEPDPFSREIASKMGIKLIDVNAKEFLESNQNTYDFIILSQTLEHLLEPVKTLQELKKHLTPKGLVYIGVPNSLNPQIPMSLFFQLAHTFNFTNRSLATTAKMAGLKVIKISNPQAFILEAILAHQEFDLPEVGVANLTPGSDWQGVVKTLRRKERLNLIRGLTKKILSSILGETLTQKIKNNLDKIFKYKY